MTELLCPRTGLPDVAAKMYRALKSKPCACGKRVVDGKTVEVECGGCQAKAAYENLTMVTT